MKQKTSIILCIKGDQVLLGMKKRGHGEGYWNGFGGKKQENETIVESAIREIQEEAGITPIKLKEVGILEFTNFITHIFTFSEFKGNPIETEEMRPQWFPIEDIPYDKMWESDKIWLPLLLEGKKFRGRFDFKGGKLVNHKLKVLMKPEK
ncbi:8-oxo-dGTP diphosphatase [candidate division WS5 bacterium]|uniref:Oxidized purine nucleoside triphosphate hydrolase n=1 Tax=candidate division WS5 bacterium TaxID=2093353 RepID=A0A419DA34_9BACT|nr:MAG: 8-oxo-dGTP diphosphatase [candidate division WS5 bacterium]